MNKVEQYTNAVIMSMRDLDLDFPNNQLHSQTYKNNLDPKILSLEGMSGLKYRIFSNRLLSNLCFSSYLEIGCYKGSTAISAMYGNTKHIKNHWLIDNWSDFGGPRQHMIDNWNEFIKETNCNLIDSDCFSIIPSDHNIKDVDVYLYDGNHDEEAQYKGLSHYYNSLSDTFVLLVDDWFSCGNGGSAWKTCGDNVRNGTLKAIYDLNLKVHLQIETLGTGYRNGMGNPAAWWSGCGIFVLTK